MNNSAVNEKGEAVPIRKWYVIYTKPRWEKKVAGELLKLGLIVYCPMNKVYRQWTDRVKIVEQPLFSMYVFVNIAENDKWKPLNVTGVINYVMQRGSPAIVRETEILLLKNFLLENETVEVVSKEEFRSGDTVIVDKGVFADNHGIVVNATPNRVEVVLESLSCVIRAVFQPTHLKRIKR